MPTEADKIRDDLAKAAQGKPEAGRDLDKVADRNTVDSVEQEAADGPKGRGVSR